MPIYLLTIKDQKSNENQRREIAKCITNVHVEATGAPKEFVNTFFKNTPDQEGGFQELAEGKVVFVNGNIRSGRDQATKSLMIDRITEGIAKTLDCDSNQIDVILNSGPASNGMEGGMILPEPGSPEEAAWQQMGH